MSFGMVAMTLAHQDSKKKKIPKSTQSHLLNLDLSNLKMAIKRKGSFMGRIDERLNKKIAKMSNSPPLPYSENKVDELKKILKKRQIQKQKFKKGKDLTRKEMREFGGWFVGGWA